MIFQFLLKKIISMFVFIEVDFILSTSKLYKILLYVEKKNFLHNGGHLLCLTMVPMVKASNEPNQKLESAMFLYPSIDLCGSSRCVQLHW